MMTDTAVCEACGADVRDESSFCYNCGERVLTKQDDIETPAVIEHPPAEEIEAAAPENVEALAPVAGAKPPLRSAASLRKQRRASNRQPVEIRWERPEGMRIGFILTAILLSAATFVLLAIALYLR